MSTQNAARLLLKAVQDLNAAIAKRDGTENVKLPNDRGKEKDQEFYAAVFESDPGVCPFFFLFHNDNIALMNINELYADLELWMIKAKP